MNKYILLLLFLLGGDATAQRVSGIYRLHMGMREGFNVWIVDGAAVRRDLYPAFLYGGNPQRYPFIPHKEIWIDNAIAAEEFEYTLAHELLERSLMARQGMSYDDAHNRALELERAHAPRGRFSGPCTRAGTSPRFTDRLRRRQRNSGASGFDNSSQHLPRSAWKPRRHFHLDRRRCGSAPGYLSRFWIERQRPGMPFHSSQTKSGSTDKFRAKKRSSPSRQNCTNGS